MSGASENLLRKINGAKDLSSVVHSMKALAASSINQYESAVQALSEYTHCVEFALSVCLRDIGPPIAEARHAPIASGVVILGSDQGLVGRFNELLMDFVVLQRQSLNIRVGPVWTVGARIEQLFAQTDLPASVGLSVPYSVEAITPLVGELLTSIIEARAARRADAIYMFHNRPLDGGSYGPVVTRLLPLDEQWQGALRALKWPTTARPEAIDGATAALPGLVRSHLFAVLFQACAQSLASENASRLAAMQRAEENIAAMLTGLTGQFHRMRQASIDDELFEVVAGYEAASH